MKPKLRLDAENFRARVAREKRERMYARLLAATMEVCSKRNGLEFAVIDDVIKAANVSRGTFYKHFDTLGQAFAALGSQLVDDTVRALAAMFEGVDDPLHRTSSGLQLMLIHAIVDPIWAGFVVHTDHLKSDSIIASEIRANTAAGRKCGVFKFKSIEAAVDLQLGSTREGIWQILHVTRDRKAYIKDLATMNLLALGISRAKALRVVERAEADILKRGPACLPWWKPFE